MISREISRQLIELFRQYPIVTVTGPRQSGKTVLCRSTFPGLGYADLGMPHERDFAAADPRGFLARLGEGAIIDEVQRVPDLLSHLQVTADERGRNGLFVLTGSEDFRFSQAISQSLAGRTAQLHLLPFSLTERRQAGGSGAVDDILYSGFYPRIIDQGLAQTQALADYFETYVERDVRRIGEIRQLSNFRRFMRLCAGRVGQPVNSSSLGSDAGVSHTTAREWLTILETSYIIFQLSPYHAQIRRRLVKSPRLYFCDVGLAAYLIGIENAGQLATHPLRGALFENAVVAEALKHGLNRGRQPDLRFFQDAKGLSCALLYPTDHGIAAIDVTAGATIATDSFRSVHRVAGLVPGVSQEIVVYGGTVRQTRSDSEAIPLGELGGALEKLEVDREIAGFVDENRVQVPDPDDDHPADENRVQVPDPDDDHPADEHRAHASGQDDDHPADEQWVQASGQDDVEALMIVHERHIHPTLGRLDSELRGLRTGRFSSFRQSVNVMHGGVISSDNSLLTARRWKTLMERHFAPGGSALSSTPLQVQHWCILSDPTAGRGWDQFGVTLSVLWRLDGEQLSRTVEVDGSRIQALEASIGHADLSSTDPGVDQLVAEVRGRIIRRIGELSVDA